ncbi:MAG: gamma carbonic anhydrase family protein [Planctomycetes bacterium]|nr:gamma carbonic anhydrase family protein [Planctomycetota bacterium]
MESGTRKIVVPHGTNATMRDVGGIYVASTAAIVGSITLGPGSNIWFNAVLRGDDAHIVVGDSTNIQDLAMLHPYLGEDLVIGSFVTIGHGAIIHCKSIGDRCIIGMGAILLAHAKIGEGSVIAAGAVVTEGMDVPPKSVVMGVPGRVTGKVQDGNWTEAMEGAKFYRDKARKLVFA